MVSNDWFKVWPAKALISDDLDSLNDHEERVWWRLLMVASLEDERWSVAITSRLAVKCRSTPEKLSKAVNKFADLGMVRIEGGVAFVVNAHKFNENSNKKRYPSDEPARIKERVTTHRRARNEGVTSDETSDVTTRYTENETSRVTSFVTTPTRAQEEEEEKEKEEEEEEDLRAGASQPAPASRSPGKGDDPVVLAPKERAIREADLVRLQGENPEVDVRAVAEDYLNWSGSAKHRDKVRGLMNQLRNPAVRQRFSRARREPYIPPDISEVRRTAR